ncbi:unnamed protein product [Closterium sp. Naga37s-1]|nr:unnamed protein product [Closterium sp. Naga37s-1]
MAPLGRSRPGYSPWCSEEPVRVGTGVCCSWGRWKGWGGVRGGTVSALGRLVDHLQAWGQALKARALAAPLDARRCPCRWGRECGASGGGWAERWGSKDGSAFERLCPHCLLQPLHQSTCRQGVGYGGGREDLTMGLQGGWVRLRGKSIVPSAVLAALAVPSPAAAPAAPSPATAGAALSLAPTPTSPRRPAAPASPSPAEDPTAPPPAAITAAALTYEAFLTIAPLPAVVTPDVASTTSALARATPTACAAWPMLPMPAASSQPLSPTKPKAAAFVATSEALFGASAAPSAALATPAVVLAAPSSASTAQPAIPAGPAVACATTVSRAVRTALLKHAALFSAASAAPLAAIPTGSGAAAPAMAPAALPTTPFCSPFRPNHSLCLPWSSLHRTYHSLRCPISSGDSCAVFGSLCCPLQPLRPLPLQPLRPLPLQPLLALSSAASAAPSHVASAAPSPAASTAPSSAAYAVPSCAASAASAAPSSAASAAPSPAASATLSSAASTAPSPAAPAAPSPAASAASPPPALPSPPLYVLGSGAAPATTWKEGGLRWGNRVGVGF